MNKQLIYSGTYLVLGITICMLVPQYPLNIMYIIIFTDDNPLVRKRSPSQWLSQILNQVYLIPMVLVLTTTTEFFFYTSYTYLNQSLVSLFLKNLQVDIVLFSFCSPMELTVSLSQLLQLKPLLSVLTKSYIRC